ncbi:MAG: hypothetical protein V1840_01650 [Candidatus Omnitrophota bacterium]
MAAMPRDFFAENQRLFSSATGDAEQQEKFNLYGGLYALAEQLDNISISLRNIETRLYNIESKLR